MDRYKLLSKLGQGGMGVVYRALQSDLRREVAIKFLQEEIAGPGADLHARFRREMDALISLSHPNIIKLLDAGFEDGKPYYVMELVTARDLGCLLKASGPLPVEQVLNIIEQLLDALAYIHQQGIIHRDIKPANVMLEESGRAILMDFGLVRVAQRTVLTQEGAVLGTPRFLPPEVILGEPATAASDLWSLGVTAYELLSAVSPFPASSVSELVEKIVAVETVSLSEAQPQLPQQVVDHVHRYLGKDPASRFTSAGEALEALRQVRSVLASSQPAEAGRTGGGGRIPRTGRLRPTSGLSRPMSSPVVGPSARWGKLAGAPVALAVLVTVWALWPRPEPPLSEAQQAPVGLAVRYQALDHLVVEFGTAIPTRWRVTWGSGGQEVEEATSARHRFARAISPWEPARRFVLECSSRRLELAAPPTVADRIRRLTGALRRVRDRLTEQGTDGVWKRVLARAGNLSNRQRRNAAVQYVVEHPDVTKPVDELVVELKRDAAIVSAVEGLRLDLARILGAPGLPSRLREELLESVWLLDRLDGLVNYLGRPLAFDIQTALAPILAVQSLEPPPGESDLASTSRRLFPLGGLRQVALRPRDDPLRAPGLSRLAGIESLTEGPLADVDTASSLGFRDGAVAGPGGRRFLFRLTFLGSQSHLKLVPPGWTSGSSGPQSSGSFGLPWRVPNGLTIDPGCDQWLAVTLGGDLARCSGEWQLEQGRIIADLPRLYVIVREIRAQ